MKSTMCRGFTLIEIMVASTLLFVCLALSVMCFNAGSRNFAKSRDSIENFQACYSIIEMITTELKEADPLTIALYPAGGPFTEVHFTKYHRPTGERQQIEWKLDTAREKVRREYTSPDTSRSGAMEFGDRIQELTFSRTSRDTGFNQYNIMKVIIKAQGEPKSYGRIEMMSIESNVYVRRGQKVEVKARFVP